MNKKLKMLGAFSFSLLLMISCASNDETVTGTNQNTSTGANDAEDVVADYLDLEIIYGENDTKSSVTVNMMLATTGNYGSTITWVSTYTNDGLDAKDIVTYDGTVTRPVYGDGDVSVTLTATITKGSIAIEKIFNLTVLQKPPTDLEAVTADQIALDIIFAGNDTVNTVTNDLTLPNKGPNGTIITWVSNYKNDGSDSSAIIASDGSVTRPAYGNSDSEIILTATISRGDEAIVKTFYVTVLAEKPPEGIQTSYIIDGITFALIYVPGKIYKTGINDNSTSSVNNDYWIGETEVTYELWYMVYQWATNGTGGSKGEGKYTFYYKGREGKDGTMGGAPTAAKTEPVTSISWRDAMVWCNALTEYMNARYGTFYQVVYTSDSNYTTPIRTATGSTTVTSSTDGSQDAPYVNLYAQGFRLPTSDEWELARRYISDFNSDGDILDIGEYYPGNYTSGADAEYTITTGAYDYDGDGDIEYTNDVSVNNANSGSNNAVVKSKSSNALGLFDMNGNVNEWNFDWLTGQVGIYRVYRGASYKNTPSSMLANIYSPGPPWGGFIDVGLRITRTP